MCIRDRDGACCAVINGVFYKRYDAKHGKPIPSNAIKCQENADPVTGHLPCWVPCDRTATGDKWFWDAYDRMGIVPNGTYEAIGPHFRANPYNLDADVLKPHGKDIVELDRSFEGIRTYLETHVDVYKRQRQMNDYFHRIPPQSGIRPDAYR